MRSFVPVIELVKQGQQHDRKMALVQFNYPSRNQVHRMYYGENNFFKSQKIKTAGNMITTKRKLAYYLQQDALALGRKSIRAKVFGDEVWKFQKVLRKCEYYTNAYRRAKKYLFLHYIWYRFLCHKYSIKLSFSVPINVFDPGLAIVHYGTITVHPAAKVGKKLSFAGRVNIGATNGTSKAPQIGDNVFIGTGAKIIGNISIADDVAIGANAVVVKSIDEKGVTYGGVPAKRVSGNNSHRFLSPALFQQTSGV